MKYKYRGISYPSFLSNTFILWFWRRFMCPRNYHLFDEVESDKHYLVCDCCQLMIYIESINDKYVNNG